MAEIYRNKEKKQKQSFGQKPGCVTAKLKQNEALTPEFIFGFISDPFIGKTLLCTLY